MMVARGVVDNNGDAAAGEEVSDMEGAFYAVAGAAFKLILYVKYGSPLVTVCPDSIWGLSLWLRYFNELGLPTRSGEIWKINIYSIASNIGKECCLLIQIIWVHVFLASENSNS